MPGLNGGSLYRSKNLSMAKINRQEILDKFSGHCAYCGEEIDLKKMQVDHVIPQYLFDRKFDMQKKAPKFLKHLNESNKDHVDNLFPACRVCNNWKNTHSLEQFRKEIGEQIRRLNEYNSNYRFAKRYGLIQETPKKIVFYFETLNLG